MKKILFVEDEDSLQKTLTVALKEGGYAVENAYDGEKGLEMARASKPDLIILDIILPKRDGFSVLEELKQDGSTKNIPVIVLTNLESVESVGKMVELGATTYLVKANYDLMDIVNKANEILK